MSHTKSIGTAGGRDYPDIASWLLDFTAGGWIGQLYNDGGTPFAGANFSGHSTSASDYIRLEAANTQGFRDGGASQALKYWGTAAGVAIEGAVGYGAPMGIAEDYVTFFGLQIRNTAPNGAGTIANNTLASTNCVVDSCILQTDRTDPGTYIAFMRNGTIRNTLLIYSTSSNGDGCFVSSGTPVWANCTVVRFSDKSAGGSAFDDAASSATVQGCAAFGFTTFDTGGGFSGDYNGSDQTPGFGTHNQAALTYTSQFTGTASSSPDFRVKSGSALINACNDNTAYVPGAVDIYGTARPSGQWTIGCFQVAAGGNVYNVSMSESGSAADSLSSVCIFPRTVSETGTAAETVSSQATQGVAVTESGTAVDSPSAKVTFAPAVAETGSAADTVSNGSIYPAAIAETGTAADSPSAKMTMAATITDSLTSADSPSAQMIAQAALAEAGSAADAPAAAMIMLTAIAESGTAADLVSGKVTMNLAVTETGNAQDNENSVAPGTSTITEAGSAQDTVSASVIFGAAVGESGSAVDLTFSALVIAAAILEAAAGADQISARTVLALGIQEAGNAQDTENPNYPAGSIILEAANAQDVYTAFVIPGPVPGKCHILSRRNVTRIIKGACC